MFLGVDGGGTKTAFCLVTPAGEVAARTTSRSSYFVTDARAVAGVLRQGVTEVCERAGIEVADVTQAFFGLPGYGESTAATPILDELPAQVLGHHRYTCDNDMVCGWAGSLAAADGINVVSGTGSVCYGERAGARARAGGWGEVFGDEGSAHWIAVQALNGFSRMSDGRLPRGPLHALLRERLGTCTDLDVVDVVLGQWGGDRARVAALCPLVMDAADLGDELAADVIRRAGIELVSLVAAVRARLGFGEDEQVLVSYSGGAFNAAALQRWFVLQLAEASVPYRVHPPSYPPVVGAALYAAKQAGAPLSSEALLQLGLAWRS